MQNIILNMLDDVEIKHPRVVLCLLRVNVNQQPVNQQEAQLLYQTSSVVFLLKSRKRTKPFSRKLV